MWAKTRIPQVFVLLAKKPFFFFLSKCDPQSSNIGIAWDLVRNIESQAPSYEY